MAEADYSPAMAKNPQKLTSSKGWKELVDEYLSDKELAQHHQALLNSTRIDHLVFPLGPKDEDDINFSGARANQNDGERDEDADPEAAMPEDYKERTTLTDGEIIEMLAEVNCRVRRIVHGETARHVYFWSSDNRARKDALDMAYKLKGNYAPEKRLVGTFNLNDEQRNKAKSAIKNIAG